MSKVFKEIGQIREVEGFFLNHTEIFYLRLYTHGLSDHEIARFLNLTMKDIYNLRYGLRLKCKTKNFVQIIKSAFKADILKNLDYVDSEIKEIAVKYTSDLYLGYIKKGNQRLLRSYLKEFMDGIQKHFTEVGFVVNGISEQEKTLINHMYSFENNESILESMGINQEKYRSLKRNIFKKLSVNNWFNAYKKLVLSHSKFVNKERTVTFNHYLESCEEKISRLKYVSKLRTAEIELSIYDELLKLYANLEQQSLFHDSESISYLKLKPYD